jgi:endonuclease/exonuclease/phosphatase (EEP) superfamily protein YafD
VLRALLIVWAAGGLLPLGSRYWWAFEIFSHFRLQYLMIALPLLVLAFARGHLALGFALAATMALNAWPLIPDLPRRMFEAAGVEAAGPSFVLLNINVEARNPEHDRVLERIRESGADAVAIIELSPALDAKLGALADLYPHRVTRPGAGNFGIAVLSRHPLRDIVDFDLGPSPAIEAVIDTPGGPITLVAIHTKPPVGAALAATRNSQLDLLAARIRTTGGPLAVCGDFNLSPYSPWFDRFEQASGTRSARRGLGLGISWPTRMPLLGTPIDHCFLRGPLVAAKVERMAETGSDHYPVRVTLRWQSGS